LLDLLRRGTDRADDFRAFFHSGYLFESAGRSSSMTGIWISFPSRNTFNTT
jgi:hypothetical protein